MVFSLNSMLVLMMCYSLGVSLFFSHTHRRPFVPESLEQTSYAVPSSSCGVFQNDGAHSQQTTSMHEGVIRDLPALPAMLRHRSLVIPQPCFTAHCIRARE
ncbi:hypothetical protein IWW34DRAFT_749927 [Fusarium oxysporum f. sp. albedinis]|uniref:Uncharacterized protein n=3 Tax=Fusarium oxysporum TaxID=5507 RepID=W9IWD5_FUSOX|nr:hypothetical protein FOXG_19831 [Fusarium oxysporum f. sp. lycopersici 4287]EWY96835.1 hypothetical protein FOYG_05397 [Fusarium oxysporum NRRL 32931]EXA01568.1 hypothetical protein FOWG_01381 [Fusarium oxysporum f. sp. lycopersici MN25]EXK32258.1 hypothetical protein FOMG_12515 [Fusarium oxysporum f. sp. melonis 26406]EXL60251.1 hypothetical protein FOCG_03182 [Fusarium oxysporum f. sp. radicis-lycopersici 26381]KAI3574810.1 hypothetical protein IWW34DRAFT_749927 [Fusarium oxysporum f. sp.